MYAGREGALGLGQLMGVAALLTGLLAGSAGWLLLVGTGL